MAFVLHQAGPPHSHGSRGAEYAPLEEGPGEPLPMGNTSVRAAFVHVLGDLLQSLGVLAASVLIYFKVPSVQACASLPPPSTPSPSFRGPTASLPQLQLPAPLESWPEVMVPFSSVGFLGASPVLFVQDATRSSSESSLFTGLRELFLHSLSTRQLTPSAPSSSPSVPLDRSGLQLPIEALREPERVYEYGKYGLRGLAPRVRMMGTAPEGESTSSLPSSVDTEDSLDEGPGSLVLESDLLLGQDRSSQDFG